MNYCELNLHRAYGEHALRAKQQGFRQVPAGWFIAFHAAWIRELMQ